MFRLCLCLTLTVAGVATAAPAPFARTTAAQNLEPLRQKLQQRGLVLRGVEITEPGVWTVGLELLLESGELYVLQHRVAANGDERALLSALLREGLDADSLRAAHQQKQRPLQPWAFVW